MQLANAYYDRHTQGGQTLRCLCINAIEIYAFKIEGQLPVRACMPGPGREGGTGAKQDSISAAKRHTEINGHCNELPDVQWVRYCCNYASWAWHEYPTTGVQFGYIATQVMTIRQYHWAVALAIAIACPAGCGLALPTRRYLWNFLS